MLLKDYTVFILYIEVASYCCTVLHVRANRCTVCFFLFLSFFLSLRHLLDWVQEGL